jgi:ubiquinone/menaquinone biosynthesis C-methylase UbiE
MGPIRFRVMVLVLEAGYSLFLSPYRALEAAGLAPGQTVVELGCGPGIYTLPAAQIVGSAGTVYALDTNPRAITYLGNKARAAGASNIKGIKAHAADSHLPDGLFDLAFVPGFARPMGNTDALWSEVHRIVKDGGILAIEGGLQPPLTLFRPESEQGRVTRYQKIT